MLKHIIPLEHTGPERLTLPPGVGDPAVDYKDKLAAAHRFLGTHKLPKAEPMPSTMQLVAGLKR